MQVHQRNSCSSSVNQNEFIKIIWEKIRVEEKAKSSHKPMNEFTDFKGLGCKMKMNVELLLNELYKRFNMPECTFNNENVTAFANLAFIEEFKEMIGFKNLLDTVNINRGPNVVYSTSSIIDMLVDSNIVGCNRYSHKEDLFNDLGYQRIKGTSAFPDESAIRKVLLKSDEETIKDLKDVLQETVNLGALTDSPQSIWVSIDDTVSTAYCNQEGAAVGYNPKRKGAKSFQLGVAFINEIGTLVHIELYPGNKSSSKNFEEFFNEMASRLPENYTLQGVLLDRGYFSEETCILLEEQSVEYMIKAKMYSSLSKAALSIPEEEWVDVGSGCHVAEDMVALDAWDLKRRFAFIRKLVKKKKKKNKNIDLNRVIDEDDTHYYVYQYEAIVTNVYYLTPEEIWHEYNQRATVENRIKELKYGLHVDKNSLHKFYQNYADILIKSISYSLLKLFQHHLLPPILSNSTTSTIRRVFINKPANIIKTSGKKLKIKFGRKEQVVRKIIEGIKDRLGFFCLRVAAVYTFNVSQ